MIQKYIKTGGWVCTEGRGQRTEHVAVLSAQTQDGAALSIAPAINYF